MAAAASLREPLEAIAAEYRREHPEVTLQLGFGASSTLGAQIRMGAPIDVLLSADPAIVAALARQGRVDGDSRLDFASNRLVVVRSATSELALSDPQDLLSPVVKLFALPGAAVPLGGYAREWLARHRLLDGLESRVVLTEDARASLAAVDFGHADAAIVYATDARQARRARVVYEIPQAEQPQIVYSAVITRAARSPGAAKQLIAALRSPAARRLLREAGFVTLPSNSEETPP